jgi:hypothetical protein
MSKETPREFWIYDSGTRDKPVWEYEPEDAKECIHVIEYAAYEKLKAERPADYFNHYRKERDALAESLKEAVEALDQRLGGQHAFWCSYGVDPATYYPCDCGLELLAKIKARHGDLK